MARLIAENVSLYFPYTGEPPEFGAEPSKIGGTIVQKNGKYYVRALHNISFELNDNDRLGLIGHNGSGKSTLLRVLAGIYKPQEGRIISEGHLGNVLDLNLGFRMEATGRRNIFLKGMASGKQRAEIESIVPDIEDFTELGPFLDQPIVTYSAGMRMRLAFSIATALHYDILLLDEWLGAGDASFQAKARERMKARAESASILVLASHQSKLIDNVCTVKLELKNGELC